jgi:hypothetical protein
LDLSILTTVFSLENKKRRGKSHLQPLPPKPKREKVLTHRPKLHSLERATALPALEKMEVVEYADATPSALEIIPAEATEAATTQLDKSEPESSRAKGQPKLQSTTTMTWLSKITAAPAATPREGRRMASVLDAVLKNIRRCLLLLPLRFPRTKLKNWDNLLL